MEENKKEKFPKGLMIVGICSLIAIVLGLLWTFVINPALHGGWGWFVVILVIIVASGIYSLRHGKN